VREDLLKEPLNNNSHVISEHSPTPDSDLAETPLGDFCVSQSTVQRDGTFI